MRTFIPFNSFKIHKRFCKYTERSWNLKAYTSTFAKKLYINCLVTSDRSAHDPLDEVVKVRAVGYTEKPK